MIHVLHPPPPFYSATVFTPSHIHDVFCYWHEDAQILISSPCLPAPLPASPTTPPRQKWRADCCLGAKEYVPHPMLSEATSGYRRSALSSKKSIHLFRNELPLCRVKNDNQRVSREFSCPMVGRLNGFLTSRVLGKQSREAVLRAAPFMPRGIMSMGKTKGNTNAETKTKRQ